MSHREHYSADGMADRLSHRAKDIGLAAAVTELREALAEAEWRVGWREAHNPLAPHPAPKSEPAGGRMVR